MQNLLTRLRKIAAQYGIKKVDQVREGDKYIAANGVETYVNRAFIAGRDIHLGIFDNEELKIASFFHELGHVAKPRRKGFLNCEGNAWIIGMELASQHGFVFKGATVAWMFKQLKSYGTRGWD